MGWFPGGGALGLVVGRHHALGRQKSAADFWRFVVGIADIRRRTIESRFSGLDCVGVDLLELLVTSSLGLARVVGLWSSRAG